VNTSSEWPLFLWEQIWIALSRFRETLGMLARQGDSLRFGFGGKFFPGDGGDAPTTTIRLELQVFTSSGT
jgi:hypothetical protein